MDLTKKQMGKAASNDAEQLANTQLAENQQPQNEGTEPGGSDVESIVSEDTKKEHVKLGEVDSVFAKFTPDGNVKECWRLVYMDAFYNVPSRRITLQNKSFVKACLNGEDPDFNRTYEIQFAEVLSGEWAGTFNVVQITEAIDGFEKIMAERKLEIAIEQMKARALERAKTL